MLFGAPLFSAQMSAHTVRKLLSAGEDDISVDLATVGTAGQFIKMLGKMSPLDMIKLVNKPSWEALTDVLLQHADDLDYIQNLLNVLGNKTGVNPAMNAVSDAFFNRRRFSGRFKTGDQRVELDVLLNQGTKGPKDDDNIVAQGIQRVSSGQANATPARVCFLYQTNNCTFRPCRYRHICLLCQSTTHGSNNCDAERGQNITTAPARTNRPPHPRQRRDRARAD